MLRPSWIVLLVALAPALAQGEPTASEIARARGLFDEAVLAEEEEDWALAATKIREAISIKETAGLRFHLAYCEEQQGHLLEALTEYERAAELAATDPKSGRDVRRRATQNRDALRGRLPMLTIELSDDLTAATLRLNDRSVAPSLFGKPTPRNPGPHRLVVSTPGYEPFIYETQLIEGEEHVVRIEPSMMMPLRSSPASAPPLALEKTETPPPSSSRALRDWVLVTEGAITTAAIGVGIGYHLAAASADRRADTARVALVTASAESNAQCGAPSGVVEALCDDLSRAVADGKSRRNVATIGFVTAGAGAAALVATWLLWPSDSASSATSLRVLPTSLHGKPSLSFSGVF